MGKRDYSYRFMCMYVIISNKNLIIRFIDIFFIFIKMYINNNYRFGIYF